LSHHVAGTTPAKHENGVIIVADLPDVADEHWSFNARR
jgi:hypothetical protein